MRRSVLRDLILDAIPLHVHGFVHDLENELNHLNCMVVLNVGMLLLNCFKKLRQAFLLVA